MSVLLLTAADIAAAKPIYSGAIDFRFNAGFPLLSPLDGKPLVVNPQMLTLPDDSLVLILGGCEGIMVKYDRSGRADKEFYLQAGTNVSVGTVDNDGRLVVATCGGEVSRLKADGRAEFTATFDGFNRVETLAPSPENHILAGGIFEGGYVVRRVLESGAIDPNYLVTGSGGKVQKLVVQSDGRVILMGDFKDVFGVVRFGIARLSSEGRLELSYEPFRNLPKGAGWYFSSATVDSKDRLYVTGSYLAEDSEWGTVRVNARILKNGTIDATFPPELKDTTIAGFGVARNDDAFVAGMPFSYRIAENTGDFVKQRFNFGAYNIWERSDGWLYTTTFDTDARSYVGVYDSQGNLDINFGSSGPFLDRVERIVRLPGDAVALGGYYTLAVGGKRLPPGVFEADGSYRMAIDPVVSNVLDVDAGPSGRIVYIGSTYPNTGPNYRIGRVDYPTGGNRRVIDFGYDGVVLRSVLALRNGQFLLDAAFGGGGTYTEKLRKYNEDLTEDTTWDADLRASGTRMVEGPDGSIYLGGYNRVQKLLANGRNDPTFISPSFSITHENLTPAIFSVALDGEGRLLVSGMFDVVNSQLVDGLVRLRPNGSVDRVFQLPGVSHPFVSPRDIVVRQGGGILVAVGDRVYGIDAPDWQVPFATAVQFGFTSLALSENGGVYAGGYFSNVNGVPSPSVVRFWADNIPFQLTFSPSGEGGAIVVNGKPGGTLFLESSVDLLNWSVVKDLENFSGAYTNPIRSSVPNHEFFRARR